MANPFEEDNEDLMKEGLFCPNCFTDFRTIQDLQEHFLKCNENTNDSFSSSFTQINDSIKTQVGFQLKNLFAKTKGRKFKNDSDLVYEDNDYSVPAKSNGPSFVFYWRNQMQIGPTKSHFDYFKKIRDPRVERHVIETNKLLIRLDKLVTDAPSDPEKRKIHERTVVQWANNPDVKLCPSCAKSFNFSRRRHHCRLCGGIMCHNCSEFLEFTLARKLITPTNFESSELLELPKPSIPRRGSSGSLMSMINNAGDPHIRVCKDCKVLLDKRDQIIEEKLDKPIVYQMYIKMRGDLLEAEKLVPLYSKMSGSLSLGETYYNLKDAQDLRLKLMKLAESVDLISRKIAALNTQDTPPPPKKMIQLQNAIRMAATNFLKENMLGLPSLPNEEQLKSVQEQRRLEIQKKIEEEKKQEIDKQMIRSQRKCSYSNVNNASFSLYEKEPIVSPDSGWGPEFRGPEFRNSEKSKRNVDPMLQQMEIIRNYIKQARDAHKYDEVHMLEENLKELEIEYSCQNGLNPFDE